MREWKKVKLSDIAVIKKGQNVTKNTSTPGRYPVILGGKEPAYYINKYNHTGKAIVVSRSGASAGYISFWNEPIFVTDGFLVEPKEEFSHELVYYLLKDKQYDFTHSQSGAAIPHVTPAILDGVDLFLPPTECRNNIAVILSRYDSLIENCRKQIKLLEEAAQRLYREWFVDFRFPGHENTAIIDGVPEGWEKKKLGAVAFFKRGKTVTKKEIVDGNVPVVAGGLEPAYYCDKSNTENRVITISGSGANAGFTRMYFEKVWASDCSYVDKTSTEYLHFTYCFLINNKTAIDNMQKGAAQPHVYAKDINNLDLLLALKEILDSFESKAKPYFDGIASLTSHLRLLTEARDRLLPKLMSGEIEV